MQKICKCRFINGLVQIIKISQKITEKMNENKIINVIKC